MPLKPAVTVYDVIVYWRSPRGQEEDGDPEHAARFGSAGEAEAYLIAAGFFRPGRQGHAWEKGNWCAGISRTEEPR